MKTEHAEILSMALPLLDKKAEYLKAKTLEIRVRRDNGLRGEILMDDTAINALMAVLFVFTEEIKDGNFVNPLELEALIAARRAIKKATKE